MAGDRRARDLMIQQYAVDTFPVGCLVSRGDRTIAYTNAYLGELLGWSDEQLLGASLSTLMTGGSTLLLDTHLMPLLAQYGRISEILLHLRHASGDALPVVANAWVVEDTGNTHWGFTPAVERDRLHAELVSARHSLEERNAELLTRAATDSLTGLANRAEFDRHARTMIARAARAGDPVTFMLVDVDWFKAANDRYGHPVGDEILSALGPLLEQAVRAGDVVARYGGDEFALFLDGTAQEDARVVADRLNRQVRELDTAPAEVTVSIGAAVTNAPGDLTFSDLFALADRALYEAKSKGRDCSVIKSGAWR